MNKIMYTVADGSVSVATAAPKNKIEEMLGEMTDEEYVQHIMGCIPKDAINITEVTDESILMDREFRNAWKQNGSAIEHDLEKARGIQLDKVRIAREPKLVELDKQFMLALEKGKSTVGIVTAKQRLRDITEPLKVATLNSIDDVKNLFPQELRSK